MKREKEYDVSYGVHELAKFAIQKELEHYFSKTDLIHYAEQIEEHIETLKKDGYGE